jgi:hypothetical protein
MRLGVFFQSSNLIHQSRVEHNIGIFLIGKDIYFLAAADAGPAGNGLARSRNIS